VATARLDGLEQRSSILVETRSLSVEEIRALRIFASSYATTHELRLQQKGREPELAWSLTQRALPRPITRRLEGDSVETLAELYGPAESLRFIGAMESEAPATFGPQEQRTDALVGLLTWRFEAWNETAWLCDIRVRQSHRRRGIGKRLVEDLRWAAARAEARGIMLETQTTNIPAIVFYLGLGFQIVGLNSAMYGNPGSRVDAALFLWSALA